MLSTGTGQHADQVKHQAPIEGKLIAISPSSWCTEPESKLAGSAGIGVATLRRIEDGRDVQLGSWIKVLKALGMTSAIEALLPETLQSPMAEVLGRRRRAPHRKRGSKDRIWGDEER